MRNGRPHVQEHELDAPELSQLKLNALDDISSGRCSAARTPASEGMSSRLYLPRFLGTFCLKKHLLTRAEVPSRKATFNAEAACPYCRRRTYGRNGFGSDREGNYVCGNRRRCVGVGRASSNGRSVRLCLPEYRGHRR